MSQRVKARACANIALCKYWGKQGPGNAPQTPSLGLVLAKLTTTTTVKRLAGPQDRYELNGKPVDPVTRQQFSEYLEEWRLAGYLEGSVSIKAQNSFPTAAGLASSASGYAALAVALNHLVGSPLSTTELTRWARRGSGSAARSILGGLVALPAGADPVARAIKPAGSIDWAMAVAIVDAPPKTVGSREGMERTKRTSPYYPQWASLCTKHYRDLLAAVRDDDLARAGEIVEANFLAMHATMLAADPPLVYWSPATLAVLDAAQSWRTSGMAVYATADAGPHVALLARAGEIKRIAQRTRRIPGVKQVITSGPGSAAVVLESR